MLTVTDKCGFAAGGSKLVLECPTCGEGAATATIYDILTGLGLLTNLQACFDAGDAACYGGAGTVVTNRAGGGVNLNLWNASAFKGTAGDKSGREYFEAGDWTSEKLQFTSSPDWADPSRQNASFTAACWLLPRGGSNHWIPGNYSNGSSCTNFAYMWCSADATTLNCSLGFAGSYGACGSQNWWKQVTAASPLIKANCWNFIAVSIAEAVAGKSFFYANGSYVQITDAGAPYSSTLATPQDTITADYIAGPVGAQTPPYWVGGVDAEGRKSRFASILYWANTANAGAALTKAQLDQIYAATKARYGH